jgi:hypothetical protein
MRCRARIWFGAAVVACLAAAVSSATARRIEVSNQQFLQIWSQAVFEAEGFATMSCPLTLEGSFHSRTLSKVSGQLIGYVTRARVRGGATECNNTGTATVLTETLPWHLRYDSFRGTLPGITGIRVQMVGAAFKARPTGSVECLARTEAAHPGYGIAEITAEGVARTARADETATIPAGGNLLCEIFPTNGRFRGTAEVFVLGSTTTRISVRLVQ